MNRSPRRLISQAVAQFREKGGKGTVNINTNASLPGGVEAFAEAGGSSIRVSLSSADAALYTAYYRPKSYAFAQVRESIGRAKAAGLFVSLNFLFFPGVSDTEAELAELTDLIDAYKVDFVQLRNLNLDPEVYMSLVRASGALDNPGPVGLHGPAQFPQTPAQGLPLAQIRLLQPLPGGPG